MPQYFDELKQPKRYYGTIKRKKDRWVVKAEPQVTQMIKELFPMTEIGKGGVAEFPVSKRKIGDLNWLMMRFPLKIEHPSLWRKDFEEAKEHYVAREKVKQSYTKEDPDISFKGRLFDFQKEGLSYLSCNNRCLLADEMGLGKTVQALAMISKTNKPVLIVVPPHLLYQWESETKRFLGENTRVQILSGLNPQKCLVEVADVYLIHYLILRGWKEKLLEMGFDCIVFDEVQELRHRGSQKYVAAQEISADKTSIIGLSGTPIYNYGAEIWNIMNVIEPFSLGDWDFFTKEWCGGWGSVVVTDPQILGNYLFDEGLMLRRRKEEVLHELPPKRKVVQKIEMNQELYVDLIDRSVQISRKIPTIVGKNERKKIGSMALDAVNNARRATGIAKAGHVCDFVNLMNLILDSGESCLLFAYHHSVIDIYLRLLAKHSPLCVTGRESKEEKAEAIKLFMAGETDLIIVNLRTTDGLNLQRARCVVFGELDWSPAVHKQAEDRIHRIGQKDSVLSYYLVAPSHSDGELSVVLGLKEWQFVGMMHDKPESKEDLALSQRANARFMGRILESLRDD